MRARSEERLVWSFLLEGQSGDALSVLVHWVLRLATVACFIGHGAFGILGKEEWLSFFAVVGIGEKPAWMLMPLVGAVDILFGLVVLVRPCRAVLFYMVAWSFWTALLRPLAGMSFFETVERAGNYGVPLALLLASVGAPGWFSALKPAPLERERVRRLMGLLLVTTSLLLIGHGGFGAVLAKPGLVEHFQRIGLGLGLGTEFVRFVGVAEIVAGLLVLMLPTPRLFLGILAWKLFTELLYVVSGSPVFEFIERGGSYGAPLALFILSAWVAQRERASRPTTESPELGLSASLP